MKRLLTSVTLLLCSLMTFAQFSGSGSGTENDPYLILNPIQLNQLRNFLNQSGVYFKLMANIDLTEFLEDENPSQGWQPIGTSSTPFKGILDGNGNTVSGLWINRSSSNNVGLFGYTSGATIKNLKLSSVVITGSNYVGALVGYGSTIINNCIISGKISGGSNVGGFCGEGGTLSNCYSQTNILATGDYVGGFVGKNSASLKTCIAYDILVQGSNYVGGLVGLCSGNSFDNCGFLGSVSGNSTIGGLAGSTNNDINSCFALGEISALGDEVGGLCGHYNGGGYNSYFNGSVCGKNKVGGLVGGLVGVLNKCYSIASVVGENQIGGLCGYMGTGYMCWSVINSCVASNTRVSAIKESVGRIYGEIKGDSRVGAVGTSDENKSNNRTIVIKAGVVDNVTDDAQNGTSVSTTTLNLKATYVAMGWNFTDTWVIQETECFPYFNTQTAPPVITSQVTPGATTISGKCVDGGIVTLEIDGVKQQKVSNGNTFSFTVAPLQAGHEVRVCAKADGKEQSYFTTEVVSFLGKGTEADPYQISTAADLTQVYRKGYYKLMNNIDLTSYINTFSPTEGWQSIGRDGSETIYFDGNGHKVTGLWCNSTRDNTGLFSCFANGYIKNLTVETASGKQVKGGSNTGILIGKMINGTIENCRVSGSVADGTPVGGIVGLLDGGKILLSQASVTINTTGDDTYVGGLVGDITSGEIDQCVTLGTLNATGKNSQAGGLVGKNAATVTNSYSNVAVTSAYCAAGLVAYNYGLVEKCYANGNLTSQNYGAGVIGYNDGENAIIRYCVAMNNKIDVTYESQSAQSGGYGQRIIGGIKNSAPAPDLNNYALKTMQVSLNNVSQKVYDDIMNGVAKTGSDLTKSATYQELGWDMSSTWSITEGEGYPSLKKNTAVVNQPGEDPEPDPDPEPVQTDDDYLSINDVTTGVGSTTSISVNLTNVTTTLTAYQFDLTLPAGVTVAKNDKGKYIVSKSDRYSDDNQNLSISLLENNTYRVVCFSSSNEVITGTQGALLNISLSVADNVSENKYDALVDEIVMTKADGGQLLLKDVNFKITVSNVKKGDANGDGNVNVSDIVEVVNDILGRTSNKFVRAAADMNNDNVVNVTDIVRIVAVILSSNGSAGTRGGDGGSNGDNTDALSVADLKLMAGSSMMVPIALNNSTSYSAFQFDLVLPEGMTIAKDENEKYIATLNGERMDDHALNVADMGSNKYRFLVFSMANAEISGSEGNLLYVTLKASDEIVTGQKNCSIQDATFTRSDGDEVSFGDCSFEVTVLDKISTTPITFGDKPVTTYTASYNLDFSGTDDIKAYVATGYDYDAGTVWLTRVKDVPAGMPVMIMGTPKETYDIPVKLTSGTYFKNMFVANTTGSTMTLPATDGDMTNYYLSNGMFKSSTGSNTIAAGKCYLQIPTVAPTPSVGSSKEVTLNGNGFASFSATQDLDFTDVEGLKAYAATGYDDASGTIWLTRVKRVSAGTGLLLMGAASGKYTIPSTSVKSYYANMMVGNPSGPALTIYTTSGDMTNYYLKGNKLLKADGTTGNTINPGKAYMQIPTAHVTRSIGDDPTENLSVYDLLEQPEVISMQVMTRGLDGDDDTTGIRETIQPNQESDVYYNLNGQRVENPGKGLYIHNGKKVIVR